MLTTMYPKTQIKHKNSCPKFHKKLVRCIANEDDINIDIETLITLHNLQISSYGFIIELKPIQD